MLAPPNVIDVLVNCAEWADRLVRADLIEGFVVTENDYTSNFTSALRREINSRCLPSISAYSQALSPPTERKTGTDGCIAFCNGTYFKVGLFEAKWPRLSTHHNCWDYLQNSSGRSHFDSQLARQHSLIYPAIWEMFYSEEPYGSSIHFPQFGSACVWHDDAFAFSASRNQNSPWIDSELVSLLSTRMQPIGKIIRSICMCERGTPIPIDNMQSMLFDLGIRGELLVINVANIDD